MNNNTFQVKESFEVELVESIKQKDMTLNFSVEAGNEILKDVYHLFLVMGEDRKN